MTNQAISFASLAFALAISSLSSTAHAEKIACDPATKKWEWHVCVEGPVEYKRGMKTESRNECKVDKVIKATDGCNLGDFAKLVPAGATLETTRVYAIVPLDWNESGYESQGEPNSGFCSLNSSNTVEGWQMMKFSEAFDKSNRERSELVTEKLKKAKKKVTNFGMWASIDPQGCAGKTAKRGVLDTKTLSKFLVYAEMNFDK